MQEQKDMTGVLFKNNRKENERHPDYTGKAMVEGYEYRLSAWIKTPQKGGDKFMSISIQPVNDESLHDERPPVGRELDDGIPF